MGINGKRRKYKGLKKVLLNFGKKEGNGLMKCQFPSFQKLKEG